MLLGDRSFVDHDRVVEYQQTGVYHVLVLAGLHVGALTAFFIWAGRRLRLALLSRTVLTLIALAAYVGIVEDRPPILRAAIMAALYLCAQLLYRRMDLLNMASLSALAILVARPSEITDASFPVVVFRDWDHWRGGGSLDRANERTLSPRSEASDGRHSGRLSFAARNSVSVGNASCRGMDFHTAARFAARFALELIACPFTRGRFFSGNSL